MNAARPNRAPSIMTRTNARFGARKCPALTACALLCLSAFEAPAQDFSVDWWTVDGGGELFSETTDQHWQLSGTIGQWDGTDPMGLVGGGFTLIGGFWPATSAPNVELFSDGFEN